ncbi:MAG: hypothetical protein CVU77_01400 [Elusimicrobia bacterium HGW-Elusimicrobia-1]|jgi:hypothetical protein|nr:MAG: hypothetical protein CVU77_01400 [Elusimicrobia bacterium HGW-Elusimicrobia-1]
MNKNIEKTGFRKAGFRVQGLGVRIFVLIFFYTLTPKPHALLFSAPRHTITVDGDLSEWASDETRVADSADSVWDPGAGKNEIKNLRVTWDAEALYVGVEGMATDKGILLYLDSGRGAGYSDLREIKTWNRRVSFENFAPDFFYGAWDGSDGNFYRLSSSWSAENVSSKCSLKNSKTSAAAGWEMKIPFDLLYSRGNAVDTGARIKIFASLATGDIGSAASGDYGYLGGDCAPDNELTGLGDALISNYAQVVVDSDGDGLPDDAFARAALSFREVSLSEVKFAPALHSLTILRVEVTKESSVSAEIYGLDGKKIRTLSAQTSAQNFVLSFSWDGRDDSGADVAGGVYIINLRASSLDESARLNKAVVVIR